MNEKIYNIDSATRQTLDTRILRGEIDGMVIGALETKERICETCRCNLTYLRRLGLIEMIRCAG